MTIQPALRARTIRVRSSVVILLLALIATVVVTVLSQRDTDPMFSTGQVAGIVATQNGPGHGPTVSRSMRSTSTH